jgi:hypothetical protein
MDGHLLLGGAQNRLAIQYRFSLAILAGLAALARMDIFHGVEDQSSGDGHSPVRQARHVRDRAVLEA